MLPRRLLSLLCAVFALAAILSPVQLHAQGALMQGLMSSSSKEASDTTASEEQASSQDVQQAADTLIKLLEDPKGREALIEALRQNEDASQTQTQAQTSDGENAQAETQADDASSSGSSTSDAAQASSDDATLAVKLGEYTRLMVGEGWDIFGQVQQNLVGLRVIAEGNASLRWSQFLDALLQVLEIIVGASVAFWLTQRLISLLYSRIAPSSRHGHFFWRLKYIVPFLILDGVALLIGTVVGAVLGLLKDFTFSSSLTQIQTFALNAFFLTHLFQIGIGLLFADNRPALRLLPVSDQVATYWTRRLVAVTLWLGYGVMLAVPLANVGVSYTVGRTVKFLVIFAVFLYLLFLVRGNRSSVRRGIRAYAEGLPGELSRRALQALAGIWDLLATVYLVVVFLIWLSRPFDAFAIVMRSTGLSLLIVGAGFFLSALVTRTIKGGVRLPDDLRAKLPALQGRLNAFIPRILQIFRILVFLCTVLLLLDVWGAISFIDWLGSDSGRSFIGHYFSAFLVVVVAFFIWLAVMAWIDLRLREHSGYVVTARVRTLFQLFRNAFTVIILVMGTLLALSEIGVDIGPLIAGAGVVGLAISFGAQTLVKDIITGAFCQIENAINEGDVVTVGGITGVVERLTVRSVRLRDLDGVTHIVPFSSVDTVSNFMRDFGYHVSVIGVSYDTDIKKAKAAMQEAFDRLRKSDYGTSILEDLEMHGVTEFADSSINIRVRIKTVPGDQWATGRAYNEFVKEVFDEWGIEIPFPQVTYHSSTPPVVGESASQMTKRAHDDVDDAPTGAQSKPEPDMPDSDE